MPRPVCGACGCLVQQCVCDLIPSFDCDFPVLVLQHEKERHHAKNTVKWLKLVMPSVEVLSVEDDEDLSGKLKPYPPERWGVLFPNDAAIPVEHVTSWSSTPQGLIVLDATWRKALRMYLSSALLQSYPSYCFQAAPASRYDIRKVSGEQALSTLEAIAYTLSNWMSQDTSAMTSFMYQAQERLWRARPNESASKGSERT